MIRRQSRLLRWEAIRRRERGGGARKVLEKVMEVEGMGDKGCQIRRLQGR